MPGHWAVELTADCAWLVGKVTGSRPEGSTSPKSRAAMAVPSSSPGYHASTTPATSPSQGMSTGPPVLSTTTVRGLAAATALISAFSSPGSARDGRSKASELKSPANTTATEALPAAAAAALIWSLTYCHPRVSVPGASDDSPEGVKLSNGSQSNRS
jgi:hypothetical protein